MNNTEIKREEPELMACGHAANARRVLEDGTRIPCCAICGCSTVAPEKPDLTGRKAVCCYGRHKPVDSSFSLPFFEYRPDKEDDQYYCGCYGWN